MKFLRIGRGFNFFITIFIVIPSLLLEVQKLILTNLTWDYCKTNIAGATITKC